MQSVRSFQRTFPIDNALFHSEVIRRQIGKLSKIGSEFSCFWAPKFKEQGLRGPKFLSQFLELHLLKGPPRLRVEKRIERNVSSCSLQNIMACPYYSKGGHNRLRHVYSMRCAHTLL